MMAIVALLLFSTLAIIDAKHFQRPEIIRDARMPMLHDRHRFKFVSGNSTSIWNVKTCGAVGDGTTDDTAAVVKCIASTQGAPSVLYFPSGSYLITATLEFAIQSPLQIRGDGFTSTVLWAFDGDLFKWDQQAVELTVSELRIESTQKPKTPTNAALMFSQGVVRSEFRQLLIVGYPPTVLGSGIRMVGVSDTNSITDCVIWGVGGTGVEIGYGSEVRISGGRIIGNALRNDSSIGVHVTGNNGGVHIAQTDIIALDTAVLLDSSNGFGSNREIFLTHATLDSCGTGLAIADSSYVSVSGCWAASSDLNQIWVAPGQPNPILVVVGGTIFNGCAYEGDPTTQCNGITVNSGTFLLTGVQIRNNKGRAVWVPDNNVVEYSINSCHIFQNGQAFNLDGQDFSVQGNICSGNKIQSTFSGVNSIVKDNLGC